MGVNGMLLEKKKLVVTGVLTDSSIAFSVARLAQEHGAEIVLTSFGRATRLTGRWDRVDGILHAIGFAPEICLGGDFLRAGWDDVAVALRVSAYSLKALAGALLPLMRDSGGSIVALDFDATSAWPAYDWM